MSFQQLITILKGSAYSGNYAHAGRPGKIGGSAPGGGHFALGVQHGENALAIKRRAYTRRTSSHFPQATAAREAALIDQQNLREKCGTVVNCASLGDYTSAAHEYVNGYLRGNKHLVHDENNTRLFIDDIDAVFAVTPPLDKPLKVYRGVGPQFINKLQPGDEFRDDGFVSTSIYPDAAFPGAEIEIRLPAGARAVYLDTISHHPGESELLIDRSYKYKVLSVTRKPYDNPEGSKDITDMVLELVIEDGT